MNVDIFLKSHSIYIFIATSPYWGRGCQETVECLKASWQPIVPLCDNESSRFSSGHRLQCHSSQEKLGVSGPWSLRQISVGTLLKGIPPEWYLKSKLGTVLLKGFVTFALANAAKVTRWLSPPFQHASLSLGWNKLDYNLLCLIHFCSKEIYLFSLFYLLKGRDVWFLLLSLSYQSKESGREGREAQPPNPLGRGPGPTEEVLDVPSNLIHSHHIPHCD